MNSWTINSVHDLDNVDACNAPVLGRRDAVPGCSLPVVDRAHDDRYDARLACVVPLHGASQLHVRDVVRGQEVGTDEQHDDARAVQVGIDLSVPLGAGANLRVVPGTDQALALEQLEVGLELLAEASVLMSV